MTIGRAVPVDDARTDDQCRRENRLQGRRALRNPAADQDERTNNL